MNFDIQNIPNYRGFWIMDGPEYDEKISQYNVFEDSMWDIYARGPFGQEVVMILYASMSEQEFEMDFHDAVDEMLGVTEG